MARKSPRSGNAEELAKLVERDLTALARAGGLPAGHGLEQGVADVVGLLTRGGKSPLLAGEPGVGKTAIVQELARQVAAGAVGGPLAEARIVEVPLSGVVARAAGPRSAAELLEELLERLSAHGPTIVYVRDLALAPGSSLLPVLLRALRSAQVRFIFEAELRRAQELLRSDDALAERLHLLMVQEPTPERARWILGRVAEELELELGLAIEPVACDLCLRLASKFLLAKRLPRKAIELLRETVTEAAGAKKESVSPEDVLARFCGATRLPRAMVDDAVPLDLDQTQRFFGERILGQTEAVSAVLRSVALLKAGLNDPRRPLGVFLFCGPTGVGKTHLARLLAEFLFGSVERLVRLNMADYPEEGDEAVLFGNPWSQTLDGKRGELSRLLDGKVFAVLLLDEFEKAHGNCHDRFMQLFDEGRVVNAAGEVVPCNNVLIVATSNVGAEVYREPPVGFHAGRSAEELRAEVDRRVADAFRAEFLNRFDALCHFQPLGKVEIRRIAQREVGRVLEREGICSRGLDVEVAPEVVDLLVDRGYSPLFGARFLQREIEKTLTSALAVEISRAPMPPGTPVKVVCERGRVLALAQREGREGRKATAQVQLPVGGALVARRRLDKGALVDEAQALQRRAWALGTQAGRPGLEARRRELLAVTQAPGFWDDAAHAAKVLRSFRAVEAQLAELERLVEVCHTALRRSREAKTEPQLLSAARAVEEAARELQLSEARVRSGAPVEWVDEVLLDVSAEGPHAAAWVRELAHMYLGWAQKRRYEAALLAEGGEPPRALVQLSGPGVYGFLAAERGLHRRLDDEARASAYVRVHHSPQKAPPAQEGVSCEARSVKRRPGQLLTRVVSEACARDQRTGRQLQLQGAVEPSELSRLCAIVLDGQAEPGAEARRYALGRAPRVEDPRTGAATPRVKDVLRGEIDLFIAAWISRPPGPQQVSG